MAPSDQRHALRPLDIARVEDILDDDADQTTAVVSPHVWDRMHDSSPHDDVVRASSLESMALDGAVDLVSEGRRSGPVIAVGGGTAIDTAKYVAHALDRPLIVVPASTASLAPFVADVARRHRRELQPLTLRSAGRVVIDPELLGRTAPIINQLGAAELIAGLIAIRDWRLASSPSSSPTQPHAESVVESVEELLRRLADLAPDVGRLSAPSTSTSTSTSSADSTTDQQTIIQLAGLLAEAGVMIDDLGHRRMFEGSEHLFVEAAEHRLGTHAHHHGQLVALGTIIMAELQESDVERCETLLATCGVAAHPITLGLEEDIFNGLLRHTVRYAIGEQRAGTILNQRQIDRPTAAAMWQAAWRLPR